MCIWCAVCRTCQTAVGLMVPPPRPHKHSRHVWFYTVGPTLLRGSGSARASVWSRVFSAAEFCSNVVSSELNFCFSLISIKTLCAALSTWHFFLLCRNNQTIYVRSWAFSRNKNVTFLFVRFHSSPRCVLGHSCSFWPHSCGPVRLNWRMFFSIEEFLTSSPRPEGVKWKCQGRPTLDGC